MDASTSCELIFDNQRIVIAILSHLLEGTESWRYAIVRRLYRLFGKSREYRLFLTVARTLFFEHLFTRYGVTTIGTLLYKRIGVDPRVIPAFRQFYANIEQPSIHFTTLDWTSRHIVRYLALYHGYVYIFCDKFLYECDGTAYWNIHGAPHYQNRVLTYRFLKQRSIHNLAYYELVEPAPRLFDRTYRLRRDCNVRGLGNTLEIHNVECLRVF